MSQISTTALAKIYHLSSKELFARLLEIGYIIKQDNSWSLTELGIKKGGSIKESTQYGQYIVWPIDVDLSKEQKNTELITSTVIGKNFDLSANKINFILSELGWVQKSLKGWAVTEQGKKQGGVQSEDKKSGIPYVRWPESIIDSKSLNETIGHVKGVYNSPLIETIKTTNEESVEFREKFEAKHRSADGHMVRSKAEMLIDNWLYMAEIVHAYERKLPIEEDVYCDFYIPIGKVYIEYWGYEHDPKYLARKKKKIELYRKYGFNLIELQDKEVQNLDDVLPRLLLKQGVQAY
jgi:very-short-patch-repair endonuclease